jgi:hypothetical protein
MSTASHSVRSSEVRRYAALLLVPLALLACSVEPPVAPLTPAAPLAAKVASGPTVTAANPKYGDRGTTIDVHITGTGFVAGAQATWLLRGVADPEKVRTNSTTYVSSTEVIANVTIGATADLSYWDVQIAAGGKNGVGTECFEVTSAEVLGSATFVGAFNDAGQVVVTAGGVYVYDDAFGLKSLGAGQGEGIDPLGTMVLGRDGANAPTAWVRQGTTATYVAELLPKMASAVGGNAVTAARDAVGTLLVGGWQTFAGANKGSSTLNKPVIWRHGASWSAPVAFTLPAGSSTGSVRAINGRGQAAGRLDASSSGAIWEDSATVTRIDGVANAITGAGTLVVGVMGAQPAYWYRTTTGAWRTTATILPSLGGTCGGEALDVNDDGVIVGKSCDSSGRLQASVWRLDLSGGTPVLVSGPQRLPGLGVKTVETSLAAGVSSTAPYVIVGIASSSGSTTALVRWHTW